MNTITQIENSLKAINQATFQSLINHLMHFQGYKFIGAPGAVVGKDKTSKGTPDSFFVHGNKYIFVECTTKEKLGKAKSFFDKLSGDIDNCFTEEETRIPKINIEKVVLSCTEKISAQEHAQLKQKIYSYNPDTEFEIFNIQNLPFLIYDYPMLGKEYLNVEIVKGDIFKLEEFLLKTTKGLQPSLTNEFIGREEKLKSCLEILSTVDRLLLSGGAGVGKSKLAVKILEEFSSIDFIPIVIQSSAVPLWDDFNHFFQSGKNYIVLFDDANKSIQNLNYLLSITQSTSAFSIKIIITCRDYVKNQVLKSLNNYHYKEEEILIFKDEGIEEMIIKVLPALRHYIDIKRKIIDLSKGNARVALMATNSLTLNGEQNYLNNPVLLYEKYFKSIEEEIKFFQDTMVLKSIAIISFFGVLDRNNNDLKTLLSSHFNIDWNELWSTIMNLHAHEILDVHSNEIAKVSDQVLATYAFYKCFIDENSAVIDYSEWIKIFILKYSHRLKSILIDVNNTFTYEHVKNLVVPHLNQILKSNNSDDQLYSFYRLFWFYKEKDCLLYLKKWITDLDEQKHSNPLKFSYVHNDHGIASMHFDLLKNFWASQSSILRLAIEMTLELLVKQPHRLSEVLKFIHESFKYTQQDANENFSRQNTLLDVLFDENTTEKIKIFTNGIFLMLAPTFLDWRFTDYSSSKGKSIHIQNFELIKTEALLSLRSRILLRFYMLLDTADSQTNKILTHITYPKGSFDKTIYIEELPIYEKIISEKLDVCQYAHCKFAKALAKEFSALGLEYPDTWNVFIDSDIIKLSNFLRPGWEYRDDRSIEEFEKEKIEEFDNYIKSIEWPKIEIFLLKIDSFYRQQIENWDWRIQSAITNIYVSIAKKSKVEFENALRMLFSGRVILPVRTTVLNFSLPNNILSAKELLKIITDYEFASEGDWLDILFTKIPGAQVNTTFLKLLIKKFSESENIFVYRMLDYLKYDKAFKKYKNGRPELKGHNVITFLTSIILSAPSSIKRNFGYHFCSECASYFVGHIELLKKAYFVQEKADKHFDYNGVEMAEIIKLDHHFINESIKKGIIGLGYSSSLRLKDLSLMVLWDVENHEKIVEEILFTIMKKESYLSVVEEDIFALFTFRKSDELRSKKIFKFFTHFIERLFHNEEMMTMILTVIYHNFRDDFIGYFKQLLLLNKNVEVVKNLNFSRAESWTGSRVPLIQTKIDFYQEVLKTIDILPNILDYTQHISFFEEKITWKKKEIQDELKRDFEEEYF